MGRSEKSQPAQLIWPVATQSNATKHIPSLYTYIGKGKVKLTLEQTTKVQRWSRGIAPLFL
jgi:hypothetical protein